MEAIPSLPDGEFHDRLARVRDRIAESDVDAGVWFGATSIEYLTHFYHSQTERPVALAVTEDRVAITVPKLEVIRVEENPLIDDVYHYFDYPGGDPMSSATAMLDDLGVESVAADMDGAPGVMGYEGPALSEFVDVRLQDWVDEFRWEKSDAEIAVMREASKWSHLAHRYLVDKMEPGVRQGTISQEASMEAARAMWDTLDSRYIPRTGIYFEGPTHTGLHSAEQTAEPHPYPTNRPLQEGDVIGCGWTRVIARKIGVVGGMYIKEAFRGQGLGEDLFDALCERLRRQQCWMVILGVHRDNKPAISLYRKKGFITVLPWIPGFDPESRLARGVEKMVSTPLPPRSTKIMVKRL